MSRRLAWAIVAIGAARAALGGAVDLGDAEAYYAAWAARPAWGYLDHPPMVAWLVGAATWIAGDSSFVVRLPSAILFTGALALLARLAADLGGRPALAVGLALATPFFHIGGFGANPDVPLAFFGLAALVLARRGRAVAAGAALGLAALSKASAVVVAPAVFVALARTRGSHERHRWPRHAWPIALAVALAVASPPLLWNATQDWPTLRFQLVERGPAFEPLLGAARFAGGQLAYVTPPMLGLLLLALARRARAARKAGELPAADGDARFVAWAAWPALALGLCASLAYPSAEPHWTMPAWLPLCAAASIDPPRRLLRASLGVGAAAVAVAYVAILTPVVPRWAPERLYRARFDLTNELRGWDELATAARGAGTLAASHYTMCAQIERATRRPVWCASPRRSQYDLWPRPPPGDPLVWVRDERYPARVTTAFRCGVLRESARRVEVRRGGRVVRRFDMDFCYTPQPRVRE